jgi:hypothetical protein
MLLATRFLNIILAVLIFISSTGFTVNSHFCQNQLKDVCLFFKADDCYKKFNAQKTKKSCHLEKKSCENNCCNNTSEYYKLDQDQQLISFDFKAFNTPQIIATLWIVLNLELPIETTKSIHYLNYKPPLIVSDLPVDLQTFLL